MIVQKKNKFYWPRLEISEKFASRSECGINYHLRVYLVLDDYEISGKFIFEKTCAPSMNWNEVVHTLEITDNIRYVVFCHGGKDTQSYAGFYGPKICNGSLVIRSF